MNFQGLFYLSSGSLGFLSLLFLLRLIGDKVQKSRSDNSVSTIDSWTQMEELSIVDIIQETHDIKSFRLQRQDGKSFPSFSPGQFLSFVIGDPKDKVMRSYSISSSALNSKTLNVSIKLLQDGVGSGWFHNLHKGSKVFAHPSSGLFSNESDTTVEQVMVAGGIGITPFLSMIETNLESATPITLHLFYGMKTKSDMAFHEILVLLAKRNQHFNYHPILSNEEWEGDKGYINIEYIKNKLTSLDGKSYYFCGPPIMTNGIIDALEEAGINEDLIHSEKFASPVVFDLSKVESRKADIEYLGQKLAYEGKQTLLEFFEEKELPAKFACRVGVCGSCKCKLLDGEVEQLADTGLSRREKKEGHILSCVSRPKSGSKLKITS